VERAAFARECFPAKLHEGGLFFREPGRANPDAGWDGHFRDAAEVVAETDEHGGVVAESELAEDWRVDGVDADV
jgi:hypothetical protein